MAPFASDIKAERGFLIKKNHHISDEDFFRRLSLLISK